MINDSMISKIRESLESLPRIPDHEYLIKKILENVEKMTVAQQERFLHLCKLHQVMSLYNLITNLHEYDKEGESKNGKGKNKRNKGN